jgi:hypothetical protein
VFVTSFAHTVIAIITQAKAIFIKIEDQ